MGKAFDFWNGLLTRELGSRLPADVWEAVLNPPQQRACTAPRGNGRRSL